MRPTSARVREAMFSILAGRVPGARVLDLYAGAGTLGLEALSRGAASVDFVERSRTHAAIILQNLEGLQQADAGRVKIREVGDFIRRFGDAPPYDLILVDPPYRVNELKRILPLLSRVPIITSTGVVLVEHERRLPDSTWSSWQVVQTHHYGDTDLTLLRQATSDPGPTP